MQRTLELEEANKELEFFSYAVSHDLRTPLRSINGFGKILNQRYSDKFDADGKEFLNLISDNANRMGFLIDGLLKLARFDRGAILKGKVNMKELVNKVLEEAKKDGAHIRAEIRIGEMKPAECDEVLVKQVWQNLISNALKYSRKKEQPVIEIGSDLKNGKVFYYIRDNGAGFDMKYSTQLFGVFKRLHGEQEFEGTGVGLALVRRIIKRHGGDIWVDAHVDEGATFYFTLNAEGITSADQLAILSSMAGRLS